MKEVLGKVGIILMILTAISMGLLLISHFSMSKNHRNHIMEGFSSTLFIIFLVPFIYVGFVSFALPITDAIGWVFLIGATLLVVYISVQSIKSLFPYIRDLQEGPVHTKAILLSYQFKPGDDTQDTYRFRVKIGSEVLDLTTYVPVFEHMVEDDKRQSVKARPIELVYYPHTKTVREIIPY